MQAFAETERLILSAELPVFSRNNRAVKVAGEHLQSASFVSPSLLFHASRPFMSVCYLSTKMYEMWILSVKIGCYVDALFFYLIMNCNHQQHCLVESSLISDKHFFLTCTHKLHIRVCKALIAKQAFYCMNIIYF